MGIAHRKQRKQQIGVSKQQDNLYFVWLDEFHKVQSICLNRQQKDIFSQLLPHLPQKLTNVVLSAPFHPILLGLKRLFYRKYSMLRSVNNNVVLFCKKNYRFRWMNYGLII